MLLTTPTDVLDRIGMSKSEDRIANIKSTLTGVTYRIASDIRSEITRYTRIDYFSMPVYRVSPTSVVFHLSQGFVASDQPITITLSTSSYVEDSTDTYVLQDDEYEIDFRLGKVSIHSEYYRPGKEIISIAYTAGFTVDGQDNAVDAPDWLQDAAISACVVILNSQNFSRQKTKTFKYDANLAHRMYTGTVNQYIRPRSSGIVPNRTTATEV